MASFAYPHSLTWKTSRYILIPFMLILWIIILTINYVITGGSQDDQRISKTRQNHVVNRLRGASNNFDSVLTSSMSGQTLTFDVKNPNVNHAIIVAGHAVLRISKVDSADTSDNSWYLLNYQKNSGYPEIIFSHIKEGISLASKDINSVLIFSGGETRKDVGPISEGLSYYAAARNKNMFPKEMIDNRVYTEEFARDSYENLLFSVCRFREVTGHYPSRVTVIGFDFKSHRFTSLHRKAIGFPLSNFSYVGFKPAVSTRFNYQNALKGEETAVHEFEKDQYGCHSHELIIKKKKRNPFYRTVPYLLDGGHTSSCPEIRDLLNWCGPEMFDVTKLPWYNL